MSSFIFMFHSFYMRAENKNEYKIIKKQLIQETNQRTLSIYKPPPPPPHPSLSRLTRKGVVIERAL